MSPPRSSLQSGLVCGGDKRRFSLSLLPPLAETSLTSSCASAPHTRCVCAITVFTSSSLAPARSAPRM
eukprot:768419-Hanusia_phi.AAC.1